MVSGAVLVLVILSVALVVATISLRMWKSPSARLTKAAFVAVALALTVIVRPYILESAIVPSSSMSPTLQVWDRVFVNTFIYNFRTPRFQEVVIFNPPPAVTNSSDSETWVKRVIGLPGDIIEVRDGILYRNGQPLNEPYTKDKYMHYEMPPGIVPPGHYFLMGDNRNNSDDSHVWGPIDGKRITGRVTLRFMPIGRMGYVR